MKFLRAGEAGTHLSRYQRLQFDSAFFSIQPVITKAILPTFGGSAGEVVGHRDAVLPDCAPAGLSLCLLA